MTDLGKVGMVMKGDYNSASTYEALDVVKYGNGIYVAKTDVPVNTPPTNTSHWLAAIEERGSVSINATTSMTYADVLSTLYSTIDKAKVSSFSVIDLLGSIFTIKYKKSNSYRYVASRITTISELKFETNDFKYSFMDLENNTQTDLSNNNVASNGTVVFYY